MKIEITDEELEKIFKEKILQHIKQNIADSRDLKYWVNHEVLKILRDGVVDKIINENFSKKELKGMLHKSINNFIEDLFSV